MASTRSAWLQSELTRALKAAKNADHPVTRTEIAPDGTITLFHGDNAATPPPATPFDAWKASRGH